MPLMTEHLTRNAGVPSGWEQVQHRWTLELVVAMSTLIEEDGGPPLAMGSGYGDLWGRSSVDHTFTIDYPLPFDQPGIKKGDRIRMWRER